MKIEKMRKKKMRWTIDYVIASLCHDYLGSGRNKERTILKLEKILFLMQNESLEKYNIFLMPYEIYYFHSEIYIKYISDILRVRTTENVGGGTTKAIEINEKYEYNSLLKNKYMKLSDKELDFQIQSLIDNNSLNAKYYKFEEFHHKKYVRKCARLQTSYLGGLLMLCVFGSFTCISLTLLTLIMFALKLICGIDVYPFNEGIGSIVMSSPFVLFAFLLIKKMTKPTKFEIKNGYLNE